MLNENVMWKNVFKSDEAAWVDDLKGEGAFSEKDVRNALKAIVDEIVPGEIIGMSIRDYYDESEPHETVRNYFSPIISPTTEVFQVIADDGYDYCNLELPEIDKLIFKKLGRSNDLGVYEILLKVGNMFTRIELIVEHKNICDVWVN